MRALFLQNLSIISSTVLLAACSSEISPIGSSDDGAVPFVEVGGDEVSSFVGEGFDPETPGRCVGMVEYDVTARGEIGGYSEVAVTLQNLCGDRDVAVESVELVDVDGAFELASALPDVIPAGGEVEILIGFEAQANIIHLGELRVHTDDALADLQVASLYGVVSRGSERTGAAPDAYAGADYNTATTGNVVNLDGSGSSDPESDALTYRWSFKSVPGSSGLSLYGSITNSTSVNASFTPDVDGAYMVRLVVSDGTSTDKDFAQWTASSSGTNTAPTADAGGVVNVKLGQTITCDGSASSDPDGDTLTYEWNIHTKPSGSALTDSNISGRYTNTATYTPDVAGTWALKLRVYDGTVYGKDFAYSTVEVNNAPSSNAGANQTVTLGATVSLNGSSSSDPDGDTITYTWSFKTKGSGSTLTNDSISTRTSATASFTPDVTGAWRVRLTVSDSLLTDVDYVDITVN